MKIDLKKDKAQLIEELEEMRQKVSELEAYKTSYLASERELRENEEKLRLMFESVTDGITVTDLDGTIIAVNKAILKLGRFDSERDVIGVSAFESIAVRDRERALADMLELRRQDTVGTGLYHLLRADGSEYPAEVNAGVLKDAAGNPAGFVSVIRDITEREQTEEVFRTVSLRSPVGMYIVQDGKFVFANHQLLSDFGITEERLLGVEPLSRVHPEDREMVRRNAVDMLKGIRTTPYEYAVVNRRGETRWFMETVVPIQYQGKRAVLGNLLNITERKQIEENLRESRRRFRDLVNLLPLGVWEIDENYMVTFANQRAIEAAGYTEEEEIAAPLSAFQIFVPEDRERMERNIKRIMNGEVLGGVEYTFMRKDGSTYPIVSYSTAIMRDGKAVGLRGVTIDISEQKQAEEMFQTISMSSPASIYIVQDGKFVFANNRLLNRVGLTADELLGTDPYDFIHPEDREMVRQNAIEMLKGKRTTPYEYRAFSKTGEMMWVAETVASIHYRGRRAVLGSALSVTERKQMEEALRASEERYRELAESITDVFFAFDSRLRYTYWNRASEEFTGVTAQDALGKHLYDIFPRTAQTEQAERMYLEVLKTKQPRYFTNEYRLGSREFVFEVSAYPSGDGLSVFAKDITEKKQAEEALHESEEKYRILVENSQDTIIIVDFEGTIQLANEASVQLSGYGLSEGIGMNIAEIVAPAYREEALKKLQQAKNGEPVPYFETAIQRKDGTVVTIEACGQAVFKDGEAVGAQVIARDISERKRAEEERQRIERLESLGTLAGGIAHDFNNILTGIMGNIGLALRHVEPEGKAEQRLLEAEKASMRARDLTQQLLTFSKGSTPVKKDVATGQLVEEAASFALRGSNVGFELSMPDDIWAVHVDEGQINGAISNLVINADEAMPQGGTIKIRARNRTVGRVKLLPLLRGNYVEVTIEDHGVGIPKEHLSRIFEPYFTTKQKGSGLGLATAYSIIKNHDGYITVESKLGVGATFHVFLPVSKKSIAVKEETNGESSVYGRGRILVMDDEESIQELLHRALTDVGYEVSLTGNGEEAVEQYTKAREAGEPFDAVILDLTVPGKMGGREAIQKLLEIDPAVRAIASSGYSTNSVIADFRNYGFSGVIAKPYRISELREALHEVVTMKPD